MFMHFCKAFQFTIIRLNVTFALNNPNINYGEPGYRIIDFLPSMQNRKREKERDSSYIYTRFVMPLQV